MNTYITVITPRIGAQFRLIEDFTSQDEAVAAANVYADDPRVVGVEAMHILDGVAILIWERNLWQEREAA